MAMQRPIELGDEVRLKATSALRTMLGDRIGRVAATYRTGERFAIVVQGEGGFTVPLPATDFDVIGARR